MLVRNISGNAQIGADKGSAPIWVLVWAFIRIPFSIAVELCSIEIPNGECNESHQ